MRADVYYYGHSCVLTGSGGFWLTSHHLEARWSWSWSADRAESLSLFSCLYCLMVSAEIPARTNPQQGGVCTKEIYMLNSRRFWGNRCRERGSCKVTLEIHGRSKNLAQLNKILVQWQNHKTILPLKRVFPCPNKPGEELNDVCGLLPEQGPHDLAGRHEKRCPKVMKIKVFIFIVRNRDWAFYFSLLED